MNTYAAYHVLYGGVDPWGLDNQAIRENINRQLQKYDQIADVSSRIDAHLKNIGERALALEPGEIGNFSDSFAQLEHLYCQRNNLFLGIAKLNSEGIYLAKWNDFEQLSFAYQGISTASAGDMQALGSHLKTIGEKANNAANRLETWERNARRTKNTLEAVAVVGGVTYAAKKGGVWGLTKFGAYVAGGFATSVTVDAALREAGLNAEEREAVSTGIELFSVFLGMRSAAANCPKPKPDSPPTRIKVPGSESDPPGGAAIQAPDGTLYEGLHHGQIGEHMVNEGLWPSTAGPAEPGWGYGISDDAGNFIGDPMKPN